MNPTFPIRKFWYFNNINKDSLEKNKLPNMLQVTTLSEIDECNLISNRPADFSNDIELLGLFQYAVSARVANIYLFVSDAKECNLEVCKKKNGHYYSIVSRPNIYEWFKNMIFPTITTNTCDSFTCDSGSSDNTFSDFIACILNDKHQIQFPETASFDHISDFEELIKRKTGFDYEFAIVRSTATKDNKCVLRVGSLVTCLEDSSDDLHQLWDWVKDSIIFQEHMIIIGDPVGLEEELLKDISYICEKAGFYSWENVAKNLIDKINNLKESDIGNNVHVCSSNKSLTNKVHLIYSPNLDQCIDSIRDTIKNCSSGNLMFYYCGHSGFEFNDSGISSYLCLRGEMLYCHTLKSALTVKRDFPPKIAFAFNCCHGTMLANEIADKNIMMCDMRKSFNGESAIFTKDDEIWWHFELNENGKKLCSQIRDALGDDRSHWSITDQNREICFVPHSVGLLKASGGFNKESWKPLPCFDTNTLYRLGYSNSEDNYKKLIEKLKTKYPRGIPEESPSDSLELTVFKARQGDSCCLTVNKKVILIDGGEGAVNKGPEEINPCFIEKVLKLRVIDLIIVSHGDSDHINGILFLLDHYKKFKSSGYITSIKAVCFAHYSNRGFAEVHRLKLSIDNYNKACTDDADKIKIIQPWDLETNFLGDKIHFHNISPPKNIECEMKTRIIKQYRKYAEKNGEKSIAVEESGLHSTENSEDKSQKKSKQFGCSNGEFINNSSVVNWIEITSDKNKSINLLFTGDADGKIIIESLNNYLKYHKVGKTLGLKNSKSIKFDYVKLPHHGSGKNHPFTFLNGISTKRLMVSTDGSHDSHPDFNTLKAIYEYLNLNSHPKVYFNYPDHKCASGHKCLYDKCSQSQHIANVCITSIAKDESKHRIPRECQVKDILKISKDFYGKSVFKCWD